MANRTQIRLAQVTGSFGDPLAGHIGDHMPASASGSIVAANLTDILTEMASATKRITGGTNFSSAQPGVFNHTVTQFSGSQVDTAGFLSIGGSLGGNVAEIKRQNISTLFLSASGDAGVARDFRVNRGLRAEAFVRAISGQFRGPSGNNGIVIAGNDDVTFLQDVTVTGGKVTLSNGAIIDSETAGKLKLTEDLVEVQSDLTVLGNDLDFAAGAANVGASVGANALTLGGNTSTVVAANTLQVNGNISADANEAKSIFAEITSANITLGGGGTVVAGGDVVVTGTSIDVDAASALSIGATVGANNMTLGGSTSTVLVPGNLTVQGTTTSVDTTNLLVKDPVIAMGAGATSANNNGGISIISGSSTTLDMVFGRIGNDTWGAGLLDTQSGSIASVAGMAPTNLRAGRYEVDNANNYLDLVGVDLNLVSAGDIVLQPGGGDAYVDGDLFPSASNGGALGSTTLQWSDLFLAEGAVINFDNGDMTLTQASDVLTVAGGDILMDGAQKITFGNANNAINLNTDLIIDAAADITLDAAGGNIKPASNDQAALGVAGTAFSDLFLANGGVINFNNGQVTLTQNNDQGGTLLLGTNQRFAFGDSGDAIYGDGTDLFISSSNDMRLLAMGGDVSLIGAAPHPGTNWSRASANTQYFNFSTNDANAISVGSAGFGIRNNNGTMQFKNNGGSWEPFGAGGSADKKTLLVSGAGVPAGARAHVSGFDVSTIPVADREDRIDVYVNGQLLLSGAFDSSGNADYLLDETSGANLCDVRVQFALVDQDVLTVVVR